MIAVPEILDRSPGNLDRSVTPRYTSGAAPRRSMNVPAVVTRSPVQTVGGVRTFERADRIELRRLRRFDGHDNAEALSELHVGSFPRRGIHALLSKKFFVKNPASRPTTGRSQTKMGEKPRCPR